MEINITCLLQIVHFCIGWYILDRLYFRPALAWLNVQDHEEKELHTSIAQADQELVALRVHDQEIKQAFMDYCKEHPVAEVQAPHVLVSTVHERAVYLADPALSEKLQKMQVEIAQLIIQKVQ